MVRVRRAAAGARKVPTLPLGRKRPTQTRSRGEYAKAPITTAYIVNVTHSSKPYVGFVFVRNKAVFLL